MGLKHFAAYALLAVGASAIPQTTASTTESSDVSPSQSSAFKAAAASYFSGLRQDPAITNLAIALALAGSDGSDALDAIRSNPSTLLPITGSIDLQSLATAPPLTFPSYSFYSGLDTILIDSIKSVQTSAALALASIDQSVLGTTASISVPTASSSSSSSNSNGAAAVARPTGVYAVGAAVGALGAAVAML